MSRWYDLSNIPNKNYVCGYCGKDINSFRGYFMTNGMCSEPNGSGFIYICHHCDKPTYIDYDGQIPGSIYGETFEKEIFDFELGS